MSVLEEPIILNDESQSHSTVAGSIVVLIPAFKAEATVYDLVRACIAQDFPVIVVDDGSPDKTAEESRAAGATVISLHCNGGKGRALRKSFEVALKEGYDWIITMDADGQHLPSEIIKFAEAAAQTEADLILGNRMENPTGMPAVRRWTNRFMSWLISRMIGQNVPDTQCGFRLISRHVLEKIKFSTDAFEIESEILLKAAWADFRIQSIPVSSVYESEKSCIRPFRDTIRFFRFLFSVKRPSEDLLSIG